MLSQDLDKAARRQRKTSLSQDRSSQRQMTENGCVGFNSSG